MDIDKINEILDKEIEFAKGCGIPQFVMGVQQAKKVINDYKDEECNKKEIEVCPYCLSNEYHWDYEDSDLLRCEHCNEIFSEDDMNIITFSS